MKKFFLLAIILLSIFCFLSCRQDEKKEISKISPVVLDTIFGKVKVEEPVILELLDSFAMQRIKGIDQSGPPKYFMNLPSFSRYEHSIGVFALLKKTGASLDEQIAGLLHDVSHTIFSNVGDHIFQRNYTLRYKSKIHYWYLEKVKIDEILQKYEKSIDDIMPNNPEFLRLKQDLPHLCADRIEYNLHTAKIYNLVSQEEIDEIVKDLGFEDEKWFFNSQKSALKIAEISMYFSEKFWGPDWNYVLYNWSASIILRAVELGLVTFDDIHFGNDLEIIDRLKDCDDEVVKEFIQKCCSPYDYYEKGDFHNHALVIFHKFRGINPLVKDNGKFFQLSSLDKDFKKKYFSLKKKMSKGSPISFINIKNNKKHRNALKKEFALFIK